MENPKATGLPVSPPINDGIAATGGQIYGPITAPTGASEAPGPTDTAIQSQADQMGQTVPQYVSGGFNAPAVVDSTKAREQTEKNKADLAAANAPTLGENGMTIAQQMDAADRQMQRGKYAPGASTAADQVQTDADIAISQLDQYAERLSTRQQEAIRAIKESYAQRKAAQADVNRRLQDYTTQVGIKTGAQRYAPNVQAGILSAEESAGLDRLAKLSAEENSLILQANQAADDQNFKLLNQRMEMLSNTRKEKANAVQQQLENAQKQDALERQKRIDQQAIEKANIDMIDKFAESGMDFTTIPTETSKVLDDKFGTGFTEKYLNYRKVQGPKPIEIDGMLVQKQPDGTYKAVYTSPVDAKAATGDIGQFQAYQKMTPEDQAAYDAFAKKQQKEPTTIGTSGLTPAQFSVFNALQDNIRQSPEAKDFATVRGGFEGGRNAYNSKNHGVGDLLLLRALAKVTDPTTGIREEEYKSFQSAMGSLASKGVYLSEGMWNGTQLTEKAREDLYKQLEKTYQSKKAAYDSIAEDVKTAGQTFGLPESAIKVLTPDYYATTSAGKKGVSDAALKKAFNDKFPGEDFDTALMDNGADTIQQTLEDAGVTFSSDLSTSGNGSIQKIASAIGQFESGGNYKAVGPDTGKGNKALGKYQIMMSNLPSWSKEALGRTVSQKEFLDSPEIQDKIAEYKMGQYFDKYGSVQDVASVWFSGKPVSKAGNAKDVIGTSVPSYVKNVEAIYNKLS